MAVKLSDILSQARVILGSLSRGKLSVIILFAVGSMAAFIYLMTWSGKSQMLPLYSNLSAEDASEIVAFLNDEKIIYELSHGGSVIQIPQEKIYEVRLKLASMGLPKGSGVGFEVFDDAKIGMTEFMQNVNYQRALQGELSRTIDRLKEVESSRVHIVMPEKSLFIEEDEPSTASIILKLHTGKWLNKDQINGIVHLVASSVSRLRPENVTIVDNSGNILSGFKDRDTLSQRTSDQLEFQERKEKVLENRVKTMLVEVLGEDKAIVRVSLDLDFVQQEKTEEIFLPENQVVRSEQQLNELSRDEKGNPIGIPGLSTNITQQPEASSVDQGNPRYQKQDNTRNYEIGKVVSHHVMPVGKIKKLSAAVIVDGIYKNMVSGEGSKSKEEIQYVDRTSDEMTKLENIVKSAVNFDKDRGDIVEVVNIPFNVKKEPDILSKGPNYLYILEKYSQVIKYLASGLFLLLTFFYVVRPIIGWITSVAVEDIEILEHLPKTIRELESEYIGEKGHLTYADQAARMISSDRDSSTQLMQEWMKES